MARLFDHNASNYMSRASVNLGLNGLTECSVGFWVKLTAVDTVSEQKIILKQIADGWNTIAMRVTTNTTKIVCGIENQTLGQWPYWELSTGIGTGTWARILFTWKRNAITSADGIVYVNGVAASTAYTANGYTVGLTLEETSNNYCFGIRPVTLTTPFDGALAWACVWNRQLTATEALQDFDHPTNVKRGLVSCVELNRFETTTDRDIGSIGGGMSITGTLVDAPDPPIARPPASIVRPFQRWG